MVVLATLCDSCTMMYGGAGLMRGRIDNTEDAACVFIFFHSRKGKERLRFYV